MTAQYESDKASPRRVGFGMIVLAWVIGLGILTAYFGGWLGRQENPNRSLETLVSSDGVREVVLKQNRQGHYVASGQINGKHVTFLLDTGATDISVPAGIARKAGLEAGPPVNARTAAGVVTTYVTRIARVELGGILLEDIRANINPHMRGDEVLLGMSFLRRLEFSQRGRELTLRQAPGV